MKIKNLMKTALVSALACTLLAVPAAASYGTVTADLLTIRTAPSADSDAVGMLSWGDTVDITYEPGNGWYEIYFDDNCYYVSGEFVSYGSNGVIDYNVDNYVTDNGYLEYAYSSYTEPDYYQEEAPKTETYSNQTYLGNFTLTAYCGCASCCGSAGNLTASGTVPQPGRTVAMGGVPFGTKLLINGNVYTVEDRGTSYGVVDIFCSNHSDAIAFGMQQADVYQID